ncbi:MAG TPA: SRPBCC family protein [Acidimicrobiales bacterium]|nr:SRPBCC family protein [Acidimicrobiales bacterium]
MGARGTEARGTGRLSYEVVARTRAPVDVVWPLVGEARRWKEWAGFTTATLLREGAPAPDGVGALRRFGVGPVGSQEEVLAWDPPSHLAYGIVKGYPVRGYRADVRLTSLADGGTEIRWSGRYDAKVPGTGAVLQAFTRALMASFARRLVRHCDRAG